MFKIERPEFTDQDVEETFEFIRDRLNKAIVKHGRGVQLSPHEILGDVIEEVFELKKEVHENSEVGVLFELADLAIAAIYGIASCKVAERKRRESSQNT